MNVYPLKDAEREVLNKISIGILSTYNLTPLPNLPFQKALSNEVEDLLTLCDGNDPESLIAVRKRRKLSECVTDEQLMPTVFELDCGRLILAHVCRNHFDETLIEIFSDQVIDLSCLKDLAPVLLERFSWANAKYFDVWQQPNSEISHSLMDLPGSVAWDCFVAASKNMLALETDVNISLQRFDIDKNWHWYQREYKAFHQERPELTESVAIEDKDDVIEAIENGLCDIAYYKGQPIAMIMAEQSSELGYKGLLFSDILVAKEFRGQSLGSQVQREFIKKHINEYDLFLGFIDYSNKASLKNAAKQGRQLLRQEIGVLTEHFK